MSDWTKGEPTLWNLNQHIYPPDAAYLCLRSFQVDGFPFEAGDLLPMDNALRRDPKRLRLLAEQRYLRLC